MARKGKRAVLVKPDQPIEIWELPVPLPQPGGVLLKVEMGGVCGTDVHLWHGDMELPYPIVLGHEGIGIIEEFGEGLTKDYAGTPLKVGDRVYWAPIKPCYHCYYCTVIKDFSLCEEMVIFEHAEKPNWASYNEYAWLPAGMPFYRIPDDTPSESVIAFGCAMPTMLQGLERLGGVEPNQTVVIQGAGPVGLAATLLARLSGARKIINIGAPKHRLEMAIRFGATHTINIDEIQGEENRIKRCHELTEGMGADVVIEAAGVLAAFSEGLKMLAKNGRYLIVGLWSGKGAIPLDPRYINNNNLKVIGTALAQPQHYYRAIQLAQAHHKEFPMVEIVTHRFPIEKSQEALEAVAKLETVKAVIIPS